MYSLPGKEFGPLNKLDLSESFSGQPSIKLDIPDRQYIKYIPLASADDLLATYKTVIGDMVLMPELDNLINSIVGDKKTKLQMDFSYNYEIPKPKFNISKLVAQYRLDNN